MAVFERLPVESLTLFDSRKLEAKHFRSIAKMPKLKKLDLNNTRHGNDVLAELAASPSLEHLFLPTAAVTDAGLEHLHKLKTLHLLNIKFAMVTEAGVKKLADALPLCKIEWDGVPIEPLKKP